MPSTHGSWQLQDLWMDSRNGNCVQKLGPFCSCMRIWDLGLCTTAAIKLAVMVIWDPFGPDHPPKKHIATYGLVFFSRGPRYVLVGGGALAKHTPEAYPEAYPRSIPRSKPPKWRSFLRGCWWLLFGDLGSQHLLHAAFRRPLRHPALHPRSLAALCSQVGWRQLRCWLAAVASLWQPIPFASTSFWCWLAVVAPV